MIALYRHHLPTLRSTRRNPDTYSREQHREFGYSRFPYNCSLDGFVKPNGDLEPLFLKKLKTKLKRGVPALTINAQTAALSAVSWGGKKEHAYLVDALLLNKADINGCDTDGRAPLDWAILGDYSNVDETTVRRLHRAGGTSCLKVHHNLTLLNCCLIDSVIQTRINDRALSQVKLLCEINADINCKNLDGRTPLEQLLWMCGEYPTCGTRRGIAPTIEFLLNQNADMAHVVQDFNTASYIGRRRKVLECLVQFGFDVNASVPMNVNTACNCGANPGWMTWLELCENSHAFEYLLNQTYCEVDVNATARCCQKTCIERLFRQVPVFWDRVKVLLDNGAILPEDPDQFFGYSTAHAELREVLVIYQKRKLETVAIVENVALWYLDVDIPTDVSTMIWAFVSGV